MSKIKLTLPQGEAVSYGKLITFEAPCACTSVEAIIIDETQYTLADSLGNSLTSKNAFASGSPVTVALDTVNHKALLQNSCIAVSADSVNNPIPISKGGTGKTTAAEGLSALGGVPTTRKINNKPLSSDITLAAADVNAAPANHTHQYAGSDTEGGAATSADKLNTNAGSEIQPVYFKDGKPVATAHTVEASVPSDAKFTDTNTHYESKNVVGSSTARFNTTTKLTNGNVHLNSVEDNKVTSSHKITGAGATTVTTDEYGNIIITSTDTDNNTTYNAAGTELGLVKSGGDVTINDGVINVNNYSHEHFASNITAGTLDKERLPIIPIAKGGTNASTAQQARVNLGAAAAEHVHSTADITSGVLSKARGGTGLSNASIRVTTIAIMDINHASNNSFSRLYFTVVSSLGGPGNTSMYGLVDWLHEVASVGYPIAATGVVDTSNISSDGTIVAIEPSLSSEGYKRAKIYVIAKGSTAPYTYDFYDVFKEVEGGNGTTRTTLYKTYPVL